MPVHRVARAGFSLEAGTVGSLGTGTPGNGTVSNITVAVGAQGTGYNFGEFVPNT